MAQSFALESAQTAVQAVPETGPAAAQPVRLAPIGSNFNPAVSGQASQAAGPVISQLLAVADKVLAPRIKKAQDAQFMQGVQQAATGAALEDILKDKPWYSELFAPSAAAEGARAYAVQDQVTKFALDIQNQMPMLAQQGPEAVKKLAVDKMNSLMTGDVTADRLIQSAAVEQFAPIMKQHAKEHYTFLQNKANDAQLSSWVGASKLLSSIMADPKSTQEDRDAAGSRLLGQMMPFVDQTDKSYERNVGELLKTAAVNGDFHTIRLFQNTKTVGEDGKETSVWSKLEQRTRSDLEELLPRAARQALQKVTPKYAEDLALFYNDTAQDPRKIPERAAAINAKVARDTGIVEAHIIPPEVIDNVMGKVMVSQANELARVRNDPGALQAQKTAIASALLDQPNGITAALSTKQINDEAAETAALARWSTIKDPVEAAALLRARGSGKYDAIAGNLNSMGIGGNPDKNTRGVEWVASTYAAMDDTTRGTYFDSRQATFYDRYNANIRAGTPPEVAFQQAKVAQPLANNLIPDKEKGEVQQTIRSVAESRNEYWFGYNKISDPALRVVEAFISKDYQQNRGLNSVKTSVERSYARALQNGLAVIGEHAVIGQPNQQPLESMLSQGQGNIGAKEVARRFNEEVKKRIKSVGGSLDDYNILRMPDLNGSAVYLIDSTDKDGISRTVTLLGDELRHVATPVKQAPASTPEDAPGPYIGYRNPRK